jgi:uncharacterized protein
VERLHQAAAGGDVAGVRALLDGAQPRPHVDAKGSGGRTALMIAAHGGHVEAVELLLRFHADVSATDRYGRTTLMLAAREGQRRVAELLIEHGADIHARDRTGYTPLFYAAEGSEAVTALLLARGADASARNDEGQTALMWAARSGPVAAIRVLLDHHADVNAVDSYRWTVLMHAMQNRRPVVKRVYHVVELLLERGADASVRNNFGLTAVDMARFPQSYLESLLPEDAVWLPEIQTMLRKVS